jgi:XTP/dITP diphosphohydrolase
MTTLPAPAGSRLVLATRNVHKVREVRQILGEVLDPEAFDLERAVIGASDVDGLEDVVETGITFSENALLKARYVCDATGLPAVADDSGLSVDVLGGAPGVFSARWSGRHGDDAANLALLLAQLGDVPDEHRGARFVCAAALVTPAGYETVELGELPGTLERKARGDGGFGYDPVLRPLGETRTCAELTAEEKNAISHRGQAVRALTPAIAAVLRRR